MTPMLTMKHKPEKHPLKDPTLADKLAKIYEPWITNLHAQQFWLTSISQWSSGPVAEHNSTHLPCNDLGKAIESIHSALEKNPLVHGLSLDLSFKELGDDGAIQLAAQLNNFPEGFSLNLFMNNISDLGVTVLAAALADAPANFALILTGNHFKLAGALAIAKALPNCRQGFRLDFELVNIGDEGATKLVEALESSYGILDFKISCKTDLQKRIGAALTRNRDLFEGRIMYGSNVERISSVVDSGVCPQGFIVDYYGNHLTVDKNIESLAAILTDPNCPANFHLNVKCNIDVQGCNALAMALQSGNCPSGLALALIGNFIDVNGCKVLVNALASGKCPQDFALYLEPYVDDESQKIIEQAMPSNTHIIIKYLSNETDPKLVAYNKRNIFIRKYPQFANVIKTQFAKLKLYEPNQNFPLAPPRLTTLVSRFLISNPTKSEPNQHTDEPKLPNEVKEFLDSLKAMDSEMQSIISTYESK